MSRKHFPNLGQAPLVAEREAGAPRASRMHMRPILGAADLVEDAEAKPVGVIGQSLAAADERSRRAGDIERQLSEGQAVVELDPAMIDPSFISDRMPSAAGVQATLLDAIRDHGQQVPILVRPHPEAEGRYQVAYGHRRLKAVKELGLRARAVVRIMSDEELAVAQGQENNERQDLSYIEKARFAQRLEQRFGRATVLAALSLYKGDLSYMLSVVSRIPATLIDAIGPAPSSGRRGWIELADLIAKKGALASAEEAASDAGFDALASDERLKRVLSAAKVSGPPAGNGTKWTDAHGRTLATITTTATKVSLTVDKKTAPDFAAFVVDRLQALYQEFEAGERRRR
ncbi:plasmid partitioning protein RepB [Beijerinckia sp. L45]|uniref:plasmid partitioning protein RepB n=1 Tax=Beijerinckia sp. L45 TaxID=1641855 RepID=UPI00131DB147|nr:plasmid partitioning protein RepB [Beijerinckia sp. L45]